MPKPFKRHLPWALTWLALTLLASLVFATQTLSSLRRSFEDDARRAHWLLEQRLTEIDALLPGLVAPGVALLTPDERLRADQRFLAQHPYILQIQHRVGEEPFADQLLRASDVESRKQQKMVTADLLGNKTRYWQVLGLEAAGVAVLIDLRQLPPWQDWPMVRDGSPTRVALEQSGLELLVLQSGGNRLDVAHGWHWRFEQALTAAAKTDAGSKAPMQFTAHHRAGWSDLPWSQMLAGALAVALVLLAVRALLRLRHDRLRTEELLRLGQMGRVNTLGELASGMVRELGEPLQFAVNANQVAAQLLAQPESQWPSSQRAAAQEAVALAHTQSGRALTVVQRLRDVVQRPNLTRDIERLSLLAAVRASIDLLDTEFTRLGVKPHIELQGHEFSVMAAPDALQQIIHHLLLNALQALADVPPGQRDLTLILSATEGAAGSPPRGQLCVQDSGPGLANNVVTQIFEPFFTTKPGALGLGLSLCDTYASSMGGTLTAYNRMPVGAEFCLRLPLAS